MHALNNNNQPAWESYDTPEIEEYDADDKPAAQMMYDTFAFIDPAYADNYADAHAFGTAEDFSTKYALGGRLGIGAYGEVRKVTSMMDQTEYACKMVALKNGDEYLRRCLAEMKIASLVDHPNVTGAVDVHILKPDAIDLDSNGTAVIVMPLFDRTLTSVICSPDKNSIYTTGMRDEMACDIMWQILVGLGYLHSHGVIHRDLKPDNILVKGAYPHWRVAITDFNASSCASDVDHETYLCTRTYRAPEVLEEGFTMAADMFAAGCIMAELFRGVLGPLLRGVPSAHSYEGMNGFQAEFVKRKIDETCFYEMNLGTKLSENAMDLLRVLLAVDPAHRPTVAQALRHPWFRRHRSCVRRPQSLTRVPSSPLELDSLCVKEKLDYSSLMNDALRQLPSWRRECQRRCRFANQLNVQDIRPTTIQRRQRECQHTRVRVYNRMLRLSSLPPTPPPPYHTSVDVQSDANRASRKRTCEWSGSNWRGSAHAVESPQRSDAPMEPSGWWNAPLPPTMPPAKRPRVGINDYRNRSKYGNTIDGSYDHFYFYWRHHRHSATRVAA